jgi:putative ABC transport system ATP-binding protein
MPAQELNPELIVRTEELTKVYGQDDVAVTALDGINLGIEPGQFVAVMGPSGSGKSTLLHLLGGLDRPTAGRVIIDGHDLARLNDDELSELRRRRIGFIFQFYNLLPILSASDNVALPLILDGAKQSEARARAEEWLERVGLAERLDHRPDQLSGGQQQRVAIARALVAEPALILADEPTGNLDTRAGDEIAALLRRICEEWGRTILMVTHDPRISAYADRIVFLKDGRKVDDTPLSAGGQRSAIPERVRETMEVL